MTQYQAYGVDMDLKHGAIVLVTARMNADRFQIERVEEIACWGEIHFGKDTPTIELVSMAKRLANKLSGAVPWLAIEWDRNRVYYKNARKSAVVQVATMIGAFLGAAQLATFQDITPAQKRRLLKDKASSWVDFSAQTKLHLENMQTYPKLDSFGDIADATAIAVYNILTKQMGEEV